MITPTPTFNSNEITQKNHSDQAQIEANDLTNESGMIPQNYKPKPDSKPETQKAKFWVALPGPSPRKAKPCWTYIRDELIEMGFRTFWPEGLYKGTPEFIRVQNNVLNPIEGDGIKSIFVSTYIDTMNGPQEIDIEGEDPVILEATELKESFLRVMGNNFSESQLRSLPPFGGEILKDTPTSAFFTFQNKIVEVQAGKQRELNYSELGHRCVWSSQIIKRDIELPSAPNENEISQFEKFLNNITNSIPERMASFSSSIGYLLHNFTKQSEAKVVWLTDEAVTDKDTPQGRNGKGIYMKAIRQLRNVYYRDGKAYKPSADFFFQGIKHDTQVVWLDDPNELFDFEKLFSVAVEGWVVSRKHREDLTFKLEDSPKTYVSSNQPPNLRGSSNYGRLHVLTAGSYYSDRLNSGSGRPIVDVHGGEFFTEWDKAEWTRFDAFMLKCVSSYLKDGLKIYNCPSLTTNQLIRQTSREFGEWAVDPDIDSGGTLEDGKERSGSDLLESYRNASGDEKLTAKTFYKWLRIYADLKNLSLKNRKSNGKKYFKFETKQC